MYHAWAKCVNVKKKNTQKWSLKYTVFCSPCMLRSVLCSAHWPESCRDLISWSEDHSSTDSTPWFEAAQFCLSEVVTVRYTTAWTRGVRKYIYFSTVLNLFNPRDSLIQTHSTTRSKYFQRCQKCLTELLEENNAQDWWKLGVWVFHSVSVTHQTVARRNSLHDTFLLFPFLLHYIFTPLHEWGKYCSLFHSSDS